MTLSRHNIQKNERGQTMVEFALVAPVLILLLFAVIQFGIVYHNYVTITDAARAGARKAAVSRLEANPEAVATAAVHSSASNLDLGELDVYVTAPAWEHGKDVTVEARYPYEIDLLGIPITKGELKSATTERIE